MDRNRLPFEEKEYQEFNKATWAYERGQLAYEDLTFMPELRGQRLREWASLEMEDAVRRVNDYIAQTTDPDQQVLARESGLFFLTLKQQQIQDEIHRQTTTFSLPH